MGNRSLYFVYQMWHAEILKFLEALTSQTEMGCRISDSICLTCFIN